MLPAFRTPLAAAAFCSTLVTSLCLPVLTNWLGHPSRERAYATMSTEVGPVGFHVREIFGNRHDADVLFLGSSLVRAAIDVPVVEQAMSAHLGRPAHVDVLALNWQGLDLQYYLLEDYLKTHHPHLLVWNLPVPRSRTLVPHVEAFHWVRLGEDRETRRDLPLRYRVALYADMVLGAPRELLSHLRPDLLGDEELHAQTRPEPVGYYGRPFVPEPVQSTPLPRIEETFETYPYPYVRAIGSPLNSYETHFALKIIRLAEQNHIQTAFLHIPIDSERGLAYMPERSGWPDALYENTPMLGAPSAFLFPEMDETRFLHYYRDQHFNSNGSTLFTGSILEALLKAYDQGSQSGSVQGR